MPVCFWMFRRSRQLVWEGEEWMYEYKYDTAGDPEKPHCVFNRQTKHEIRYTTSDYAANALVELNREERLAQNSMPEPPDEIELPKPHERIRGLGYCPGFDEIGKD